MKMSDVVKVAGSIGGVANAVNDLLGPGAGSWEASLQQASFGGVPFGVNGARLRAGRRHAVHVYPYRDDVWPEDQGKLPREFRIHGFLIEDSAIYGGGGVVGQREAFLRVCEAAGPKTLVHPTLGTVPNVACLGMELEERKDLGRVFEFTLTLIVSGERKYPAAGASTGDLVNKAAEDVRNGSLLDMARKVTTAIKQGAAVVQQAVNTAVRYYQVAVGIVNSVRRVFNAVSSLRGNFGRLFGGGNSGFLTSNSQAARGASASDLLAANVAASAAVVTAGAALQRAAANIADTQAYGGAVNAFVGSVAATAVDPTDGLAMLARLSTFQPVGTSTSSPVGQAISTVNVACSSHFRRVTIASLAQAAGAYQPFSQEDATRVQTLVVGVIDSETLIAGDMGDDATYDALRSLRKAVVADFQKRGGDLAEMEVFAFNASLPALALASRIYRDPGRADELVRQVDPIHPAFMPSKFEALSK